MTYLVADVVTGVYETESLFGEDCETLSQSEFYDRLDSLEEYQTIACSADAEYCQKIESEYGVQWIQ